MEFLKCKSVIALIVMILGVSYISALDNATVQNHAQDDNMNVVENA